MADEQPDVVILDPQGTEHVFPPGFDPVVGARIVRESGEPQRLGSAKTGGYASNDPNLAPDFGAMAEGVASAFNPMNYVRAAKTLLTTDPRITVPALVTGAAQPVRDLLNAGSPNGQGSRAIGALGGALLTGPVLRTTGTAFRAAAPTAMDMGLQRTLAQRLEFPNTPQRLVDEGILPIRGNVQQALTATEQKLNADARAYDAAAATQDTSRMLPPGRQNIPLGTPPTPQGGQLATPLADMTELREQNQVRQLQGLHPDNPRDPIFGNDVRSAAPQATADTVSGPGVLLRPMASHAARIPGAAPTMVDPQVIADAAARYATDAGKIGALGDVPGAEAAAVNAAKADYLAQNTRPRTLTETIAQKRAYQDRASYPNRPNAPTVTNENLNFNTGVAGANRAEAIRLNPALEGDLAKEQDLLGALTAQKYLEAKSVPLSTVGTIKTLVGLRNPGVMGGVAIGLDRAGGAAQAVDPAAVRAALLQLMASHPVAGDAAQDSR